MLFIIYFTGAIAAYCVARAAFVVYILDGDRDKYTTGDRLIIIGVSFFSWCAIVSIVLTLAMSWTITLPSKLKDRAKW